MTKKLPLFNYKLFFLFFGVFFFLVAPSLIEIETYATAKKLESVKFIENKVVGEPVDVYNLTVDGNETFFANNLAVHNKGTDHYAYFFLDSNGSGSHDQGETVTSSRAYTTFFSPCKEEDGPWHSETKAYKPNDNLVTHRWWNEDDPEVAGSNDARMGLTTASFYGCGPSAYAVPQTNRDSPYYPGGVRFKDYDGSPRPVYRYKMAKNDTDDKCTDDSSRLTFQNNYSNDWKSEKDYRGTGSGFELNGRGKYLLQVAEFTVDYTGSYYLKVLDGGGTAAVAPKTRDVNMPVGWIDQNTINWSDYQQDNSYASYTPTIRQINAYCTSSDCGEGMITDDNKYYNRGKSGQQYELDYYNTTWSSFSDITDAANQVFASFGGTANVKDIMVWSQPQWQCGGGCALVCSAGDQWLITKDNPPRAFSRSRSCNGSWSSFADVTASANQGLAFLGGLNNVKSRDISCNLNSCTDRILTHGNQVWQRTATVTGTFGCATSCGGDCDRCFSWTWGSFSDVTSTYNQALGVVGLTVGDVEDIDQFCVDEPAYSWGWQRRYCKDTVITTDGRAFFREYKKLNEWWAIGAGESVCSGGGWSTPPGSCYLEKDKAYLMILSAHTSVRDDCYVYNSSSGFPFLFWRGGQEVTGGWYENNKTSAIPIANITPTVSGRVYNDANLNCADNTETGIANATVYLDSWGSNPELTDSLGAFILNNVTVGQHKIYIQPAPDYVVEDCTVTDTTLKYDLVGGSRRYYKTVDVSGSGATANFALVRSGSISGYVYQNSNPTVSCASLGGTGVPGVRVFSTDGSLLASTNADGYFILSHSIYGEEIPAGTYVLDVDNIPVGMTEDNIKYCPSQSVIMAGDDIVVKIGLLSSVAWWQVTGGDIHADGGSITSTIPHPALCSGSCEPYLMVKEVGGDISSIGLPTWRTGSCDLGSGVTYPDNISERTEDWRAMAGQYQGVEYKYDFWNSHLGSEEGIETLSDSTTIPNPDPDGTKIYEYKGGNLEITGGVVNNGDKVIILHGGGNLSIAGDITVVKGGFLMVVTSGDMSIADTVSSVEGIYIVNGTISFGSEDNDTPLTVEGSLIGWTNIDLSGRDFGDETNNEEPVLKFIFRPDFLIEAPEVIRRPQYRWQEIVP